MCLNKQFPNLPTDNLYKFTATFGLVLIVFGAYMLNLTINNAYLIEDELNAKNALFKIDSLQSQSTDSLYIAKLKVQIGKEYKQYRRVVNKLPSLSYLYLFLLLLGFGLASVGFYNWLYKTQKLNDEILVNDVDKIKNDKLVLVHKIQFEKEFEVYNKLWIDLISLRNSTQELRPVFEFYLKGQTEDEIREAKWKVFSSDFQKCLNTFENNKPFYPEEIYSEIEAILRISKNEAIEFEYMPKNESDYFKNKKNMDGIIDKIDKTCILIRDRIGLLKLNN